MRRKNKYRPVNIYDELHNKIAVMAKMNDITMKILASEIVARMFEMHTDEVKEIIKEIKIMTK